MTTRTVYTSTALEVLTSANFEKHAKGWLGYASVTAVQSGIGTSATDLTGLTVTVTVPANRLLKISGYVQVNPSTTGTCTIHIVEDSTTIGRVGKSTPVNAVQASLSGFTLSSAPSAGSHTYKLQGQVDTGTFSMEATSTAPAWIVVEDIGPSS